MKNIKLYMVIILIGLSSVMMGCADVGGTDANSSSLECVVDNSTVGDCVIG